MKLFSILLCTLFLNAVLGSQKANAQPVNLPAIHVVNSPNTLGWPITTRLTSLEVTDNGIRPHFDKCDSWPNVTPPGWGGPLRFTLHLFLNVGGEWWESGIIQFWACDQYSGGPIYTDNQIARNWVYDNRWGSMVGHQPAPGELIGFMVSAGNARGQDDHIIEERSNIVAIAMPRVSTVYPPFAWEEGISGVPPIPVPAPVPTPIPVPVPPLPPLSSVDLSGVTILLQQCISSINQTDKDVNDGRKENQEWQANVRSVWQQVGGPLLKYVVPALTAYFAGKKL